MRITAKENEIGDYLGIKLHNFPDSTRFCNCYRKVLRFRSVG